jgi:hypothetical protein
MYDVLPPLTPLTSWLGAIRSARKIIFPYLLRGAISRELEEIHLYRMSYVFISIIFLSLLVTHIFLGIFIFRYVRLFLMPQDSSSVIKSSSLSTYVARATPSRVEVTVACPKA